MKFIALVMLIISCGADNLDEEIPQLDKFTESIEADSSAEEKTLWICACERSVFLVRCMFQEKQSKEITISEYLENYVGESNHRIGMC